MRCFYHPETDSVGICQECGKSACRQCIDDIDGAMTCKGCQERRQTLWRQQQQEAEEERQAEWTFIQQQARKRIRRSYICGCLGLIFFSIVAVMSAGENTSAPIPWLFMIPFAAYLCWSIYWGFVWFWPKWRSGVRRLRQALSGWTLIARPFVWVMLAIFYVTLYLSIPLSIAIYYGVFGGGIFQFLKHRRLAAADRVAAPA
jgi:hypothetical protein